MSNEVNIDGYREVCKRLAEAETLLRRGVKIINCRPGTSKETDHEWYDAAKDWLTQEALEREAFPDIPCMKCLHPIREHARQLAMGVTGCGVCGCTHRPSVSSAKRAVIEQVNQ